jgi:hypothetical protein
MKHIHLFQHIGGGCDLQTSVCDDDYSCECGAKFRAESVPSVHFTMPQNIAAKEEPEEMEVNLGEESEDLSDKNKTSQ